MPSPLYARLQQTAERLISNFGQIGTIERITPPDPVTGGDPVETSYTAKLVPMTYDQRYINGTVITTADRQIYISSVGLAIVPHVGDVVTAGGVDYHVIAADPNNYDGVTNVVFIVQGRISS
ncbi:hypothetical protein G9X67_14755 [Rhizobium sp. WYCCWR 11152]|uniref:hypothetical protein n=1 Tax=Rhizobium sp. WYCCWR 11152 TaxID=2692316 RepID=UPI0014911AB0|nr:hypothetical protein [Rhizobium sp. WYCCWR 11152]NNU66536.1 hypothetical protein [Rhizobium sp. WYCCWR 11152]